MISISEIMFMLLLIFNIVTFTSASEQKSAAFFNGGGINRNNHGLSNVHVSPRNSLTHNATYIDKSDNLLRIPNKYYEEPKNKKKVKKSPKRTVQKIIKKNKFKTRKLYLFPATISPTLASKAVRKENAYTRNNVPTTEINFKKRPKKNPKYTRYPMPFQKLQRKDGTHNRYRREDKDVLILKDLDEIEFLSDEKDHDKLIAHVQKNW